MIPAASTLRPRWPQAKFSNGTIQTNPVPNVPAAKDTKTPTSIPTPIFETVSVAPASALPPPPTRAPVPNYVGVGANILQGYCTEPAYTILDGGPTVLWMPVVGCISSKSDCCPTRAAEGGAGVIQSGTAAPEKTAVVGGGGKVGGGAQFPISLMPSQGTLKGCPNDYHTVGGTACCPSSYWLWSTALGGQIPCYSSLSANIKPPPIPDTLVDRLGMTITDSDSITSSTSGNAGSSKSSAKPTSAIVNVAFAMQYPVGEPDKAPPMETKTKVGIGVGAGGAAVIISVILWFLLRRCIAKKRERESAGQRIQSSVAQRWGDGVDKSLVAHEVSGTERRFQGKTYAGVHTTGVNY